MIYSSDFNYLKRYTESSLHKNKTEAKLNEKKSFWKLYCERSTIAETYHLVNPASYGIEKLVWLAIFIVSISYTVSVCTEFFRMFANNMIDYVLEDIQFPIYKIRFPAVTVCNLNHLNWNKFEEAKDKFLPPNRNKSTEEMFERFISAFESYHFGIFKKFQKFDNDSLIELDSVNLNEVLEFLSFTCDELFSEKYCKWRNRYVNCCEVFEPQKSIFGHCFTFNSQITKNGLILHDEDSVNYPRRSPGEGPRSGLRFRVNLHLDKKHPGSKAREGLQVIVHKPTIWPSAHGVSFTTMAIPQTETVITLQPDLYTADKKVMKLKFSKRLCLFEDEEEFDLYEYLPGQEYSFGNCLLQCKLRYAQQVCGCIPDMTFPASNRTKRPCRASDFKCLASYDGLFKQFTLESHGKDDSNLEISMHCRCTFNCATTNYHGRRRYYFIESDKSLINVEVFFNDKMMIMYQMTLAFDWRDLLVSFGGIAGLFIGCSIISFVEIFYHFYIGCKGHKTRSTKISVKK